MADDPNRSPATSTNRVYSPVNMDTEPENPIPATSGTQEPTLADIIIGYVSFDDELDLMN